MATGLRGILGKALWVVAEADGGGDCRRWRSHEVLEPEIWWLYHQLMNKITFCWVDEDFCARWYSMQQWKSLFSSNSCMNECMLIARWRYVFFFTHSEKNEIHAFFFIRTTNLNLSLGVLKSLAYFRLKSYYFVLNFFVKNKCYLL